MLPCFAFTLLLSAALLFSVQPLCGRLVLPLLGGTPAVWTTCMLFFQGALLLGYLYAHGLSSRLPLRRQLALHLGLSALGLLQLPVALGARPDAPPEGSPALFLLLLLSRMVLVPLLVTATTAPLLQRWFASSAHRAAKDPYFLYAASNLGSLAALLAYPFLVEPHVPLGQQGRLFGYGYGLLIACVAACGALALRRPAPAAPTPAPAPPADDVSPWPRRLRWIALSFVPSSLMLGVTTHLGTDIAAVPLLWVLPLALYLLSFILAFSRLPDSVHRGLVWLQPLAVLGLVFLGVLRSTESTLMLPFHLAVFFLISLVCHGELWRGRPGPEGLTAFYLWLSVGGALGGLCNAILAPLLFSRVLEYPLALVLACMLLPAAAAPRERGRLGLAMPLLVGVLCAGLTWVVFTYRPQIGALGKALHLDAERLVTSLVYALPLVLCYTFLASSVRFGVGVGAVILAALLAGDLQNPVLHRERSFFGVLTVQADKRTGLRHLLHGTTLHGKQWPDEARRREPLSYFHRQGPIGEVFDRLGASRREVGLVGLGAGTLSAYGLSGQRFTFYEIDPAVVRIARDPRLFTYLSDSRAEVRVVIGDARRRLQDAADGAYELLVLDAFSSDAIPVHLLTREALALYLRKLAPGGVLVLHISNRYFRLAPVVGRLAADAGLQALLKEDPGEPKSHRDRSVWVALAREGGDLAPLRALPGWAPPVVGERLWTDDFADPISALRWR